MRIFRGLLIFLLILNCAGSDYNPNFSNDQFLEKIQGIYESNYKNIVFEIWVEKLGHISEHRSTSTSVLVFVFEKNRRTEVEMFLRKYQDSEALSKDVCSYRERLDWGVPVLWRKNDMGGLAEMSIPTDIRRSSSFPLQTMFFIDFPVNDEFGFVSLDINNDGEVKKINFFETGFIKKPWNYFLNSSMTVQKISQDRLGLLSQFYDNSVRIDREISKHQRDQSSYCN